MSNLCFVLGLLFGTYALHIVYKADTHAFVALVATLLLMVLSRLSVSLSTWCL